MVTKFANAFSSVKKFEFQLKFHWSLFLGVQLTMNKPTLAEVMALCQTNDKSLQDR